MWTANVWFYATEVVLTLLVLAHLLYHRRSTQTLIIWMLVVLLLPWIGALIYLLFGSRKVFARREKPHLAFAPRVDAVPQHALHDQLQRLLMADGVPPAVPGNRIETTLQASEARRWFFEAIENARHSIWLETYIFELDETGHDLLARLTRKAQEGVDVRLLMDAFGSWGAYLRPWAFRALREAGGQVAFFQPLSSLFKSRINLRTHRKIYLFDERTLISGGINLAREYLGEQEDAWVDLTYRLTGPVVHRYAEIFAQDWAYTTDRPFPAIAPRLKARHSGLAAQAVPSGPDVPQDSLREALMTAMALAQSRIDLITPYFIPDTPVLETVLMACKRGIRVRLLTPAETDHAIFDLGRAPYMRDLTEAGAEIGCYTPSMLHAKAVIVDDHFAMIGSANLDYRSLLINYEMVTFCYDPGFILELRQRFDALWQATRPYVPPASRFRKLQENLIRMITPLL